MNSSEPVLPMLEERPTSFDYDYRIHCACGGISTLTAADYNAEMSVEALMPCEHCDSDIHFGPAVAAIRDPTDPALDNSQINRLAWYHTSTSPDWPSTAYADEEKARLRAVAHAFPSMPIESILNRHLGQALHVGTYEAAIENMLRRMRDQDCAADQFFLYRVALAVDPDRVEDGFRDENHEPAAQLLRAELQASDLDAVRYLNVHEAVGSISLAVLPEAVVCAQRVSLPVFDLVPAHDMSLLNLLDDCQKRLDELARTAPDISGITPIRLRMMQLLAASDPDGIGATSARHQRECGAVWNSVHAELSERYLAGISPVVVDDFRRAIGAWHRQHAEAAVRRYADFFAASTFAMTNPGAITALLAGQQPRAVNSGSPQ